MYAEEGKDVLLHSYTCMYWYTVDMISLWGCWPCSCWVEELFPRWNHSHPLDPQSRGAGKLQHLYKQASLESHFLWSSCIFLYKFPLQPWLSVSPSCCSIHINPFCDCGHLRVLIYLSVWDDAAQTIPCIQSGETGSWGDNEEITTQELCVCGSVSVFSVHSLIELRLLL